MPERGRASVENVLRDLTRDLAEAGVEAPASDAKLLVCAAAGLSSLELALRPGQDVSPQAREQLAMWAVRRIAREPVTRILGRRGFWSFEVRVGANVLDPRPDSEIVVEASLRHLAGRQGDRLRILDLGTGSGILLAALLGEFPHATGVGVDMSADAARLATENLDALGFGQRARILNQDWACGMNGVFDLIVSNPPYIATSEIAQLSPEVRNHDPTLALDGGADGLDAYRSLSALAPGWLESGGVAAFEIGATQGDAVTRLVAAGGLEVCEVARDYAGHTRVVVARKP